MMSLCHYGDHGAMQPYSMALLDAMVDFFNLTFIPSPDLAHAYAFWSSFSHTSNSSPALTCWHIMVNNGQAHNYQVPGQIKIAKKRMHCVTAATKIYPKLSASVFIGGVHPIFWLERQQRGLKLEVTSGEGLK